MRFRLCLLLLFYSPLHFAFAQCQQEYFTGEGTFYSYLGGGNCSFPTPYNSLHSAALNASQYINANLCGACAEITGEKGSITVSLEDQCPECKPGDIDLESDAFPFIAEPIRGRVPIQWKIVSCPVTGPVAFYFKEGSSQYWTAVQVRNHANPISKLEYLVSGNYIEITRVSYNYFEVAQGMGPGPYTFRITDYFGNVIIETAIPFEVTTPIIGKNQFPPCIPLSRLKGTLNETDITIVKNTSIPGEFSILNKNSEEATYEVIDLMGRAIENGKVTGTSEKALLLPEKKMLLIRLRVAKREYIEKLIY